VRRALLLLLLPSVALADPECEEALSDCKDTCVIGFGGSIRVEARQRYERCMKQCLDAEARCTAEALGTKGEPLDDGARDDAQDRGTRDGTTREGKEGRSATKSRDDGHDSAAPATSRSGADAASPPSKERGGPDASSSSKDRRGAPAKDASPGSPDAPRPPKERGVAHTETPAASRTSSPGDGARGEGGSATQGEEAAEPPASGTPAATPKKDPRPKPPPKKEEDHDDLRNY
jgi:hypothetical protein